MGRRRTRTRILVSSLLLFNENGVAGTTTNDIANETDISPGNLHYHFRKKSQLVEALLAEFQVDVRDLLTPSADSRSSIDEFWSLLHGVLEILTAYRFLFRDTESLVNDYPGVGPAVRGFTRALVGTFALHIQKLADDGVLSVRDEDSRQIAQHVSLVMLFGERFDAMLAGRVGDNADAPAIVRSVLSLLSPHASPESRPLLYEIEQKYQA